jgi:hypothetical protein
MAVAMMVDNPEGTQEIYDRVRERLGMENATGGIFHIAGPSPNGGWRVIEVWESEEDAKRFVKERMLPAFEALGPYHRLRPTSGPCTTTWHSLAPTPILKTRGWPFATDLPANN